MNIFGISLNTEEIVLTCIIGAGAVYAVKKLVVEPVAEKLPEIGEAINPVNNENIFAQGANSIWQAITGSTESIGADIYDLVHSGSIFPEINTTQKKG